MEYLIAFAVGIYILYLIIKYIGDYPKRKRQRERENEIKAELEMVQRALNGFDIYEERLKVTKILKDTLPSGYICRKQDCGGLLLVRISESGRRYYICNKCHNFRTTIRNVRS